MKNIRDGQSERTFASVKSSDRRRWPGRQETMMDGPSRGGSHSPNEINRDPPLSAGHLPAGYCRRPVFSQIASCVGSTSSIRDRSFIKSSDTDPSTGIQLSSLPTYSRVSAVFFEKKQRYRTSGCFKTILWWSGDSRHDRERDHEVIGPFLFVGEYSRFVIRICHLR